MKFDFLLRNPLAPVRNAVQVLRLKGLPTPELKWASDVIDRQVQSMSRLIDDLMDVSRINQGKIELRRKRVAIASILQDAIESTRPLINECCHQLTMDLPQRPLMVDADATRLAQAFMNLLNNAAKYMDRGGHIQIAVRDKGEEVVVVVKDRGIGLAGDRLESVFEMFSQVETALSRSRGGLGIGLSLTRRLVEMHGGAVKARSKGPGHGSEFEVRLPLASEGQEDAQIAAPMQLAAPGAELRILIADDNKDAAATLAELLEVMGHVVEFVYDGEAAVRAVADFDPDVVLLDIGMPKLNGYQACREIRALPNGAVMTIVAVTGWGQPEDKQASQDAGFDRHLVKPTDLAALVALLTDVGANGRQSRAL